MGHIVEFQKVDPGADGFRYPTDRKGGPSLTAAPRVVDLNAFHEAMEAVVNFLSGVAAECSSREAFFREYEGARMTPEERRPARLRYMLEHRDRNG